MKKLLIIFYIIDIIFILISIPICFWWNKNHGMPGLADMFNIRRHLVYMAIAVIVFVILTIYFVKKSYNNLK